jgi:signal recognition particle subunit SRP72
MAKGKYEKALDILTGLKSIKYTPAVVSLVISLYNVLKSEGEATAYLDEAIKFGQENPAEVKKDHVVTFMKESSNLKLANGDVESAVKMLEVLRSEVPSDITTVAKIVAAYSKIDAKKAQEYSIHLPPLSAEGTSNVDVNALEMTNMIGSFRFSKKVAKQSPEDGDVNPEVIKKRKNRKKKKGKLPKNYNPDVDPDPERWLPRWERSTFKHKKTKRGMNAVGKGTQGSSASAEQVPSSPKPTTSPKPSPSTNAAPNSPSAPNVVPPRQQKPGAKSKPKKKKGGKW